MIHILFPVLGLTVPVVMTTVGFAWRIINTLDKRLDRVDIALSEIRKDLLLNRQSVEARLEMLEYRVNANTELINHRSKRHEGAIATLSQALQRVSDGRYVPRHQSTGWPTDDPPTEPPA